MVVVVVVVVSLTILCLGRAGASWCAAGGGGLGVHWAGHGMVGFGLKVGGGVGPSVVGASGGGRALVMASWLGVFWIGVAALLVSIIGGALTTGCPGTNGGRRPKWSCRRRRRMSAGRR